MWLDKKERFKSFDKQTNTFHYLEFLELESCYLVKDRVETKMIR